MSNSIREFFDDVGDEVSEAVDDVATEVGDSSNDVRNEVNDDNGATNTTSTITTNTSAPNATTTNTVTATTPSTTTTTGTTPGGAETSSTTAQVTRLYEAAFDRAPDEPGLTFWTNTVQSGVSLDAVADFFVASPEFQGRYGTLGSGEFVDRLYLNVLERESDPAGRTFWTSALDNGRLDRGGVTLAFSESPENVAQSNTTPSTDDPLV